MVDMDVIKVLVLYIEEEVGLAGYETMEFEEPEEILTALRHLITQEMFSREDWFGISVGDYEADSTQDCYSPLSCHPGACAQCHKFDVQGFVTQVMHRLEYQKGTGWQYRFFSEDSTGRFVCIYPPEAE